MAFANNAFRQNFTSIEEIFNLEIPPERETLRLRFKKEQLAQPIFWDVDRMERALVLEQERVRLRFKEQLEQMAQPMFRNIDRKDELCIPGISNTKALPYHKFRAQFVWLGDFVGMELRLELYHMRGAPVGISTVSLLS